jgi:hypothetical protein
MTPWRKRAIVWGGVLSALVVTPIWLYHHLDLDDPFDDSSFDRATWIQHGDADDDNPRGHMVESLVDRLKDNRPRRGEVIDLLGPSDRECGRLEPPVGPIEMCLSYHVGSWSGFRMDPDTLDVYFGADGRFLDAFPVQH